MLPKNKITWVDEVMEESPRYFLSVSTKADVTFIINCLT